MKECSQFAAKDRRSEGVGDGRARVRMELAPHHLRHEVLRGVEDVLVSGFAPGAFGRHGGNLAVFEHQRRGAGLRLEGRGVFALGNALASGVLCVYVYAQQMTDLPLQLSGASGVPMYRQIVDQMSAMIGSGQLAPGTRLPSVRELAASLLVSLITVRRAYTDLEAAGLIESRQGQGTFVAEDVAHKSRARSRREAVRVLLEAITAARQLGLSDDEIREHIHRVLDRPSDAPWRP